MDLQKCEMSRDRVSLRITASGCPVGDVIIAKTVRSLRGGNPPSTGEQVDGSFRLPAPTIYSPVTGNAELFPDRISTRVTLTSPIIGYVAVIFSSFQILL